MSGTVWDPSHDEEPQGAVHDPEDDKDSRRCIRCNEIKALDRFRLAKGGSRTSTCIACISSKRYGLGPPPLKA